MKLPINRLPTLCLLFLGGLLLLPGSSALGQEMYRYINAEGHPVLGYQVPPELIANGYEVLNEKGQILRVVPRQLDEAERAQVSAEERSAAAAEAERERLRQWDEALLLRYSTIDDIEAARDRALRDLKIRVSILKGKLRSLQQQVENYQALAADQERQGVAVDAVHLKAIDDLQSEILSTERAAADRQQEIAEVEDSYARDIERFASLLDIVRMRNALSLDEQDSGS